MKNIRSHHIQERIIRVLVPIAMYRVVMLIEGIGFQARKKLKQMVILS
jgi:hypothetical protein